MDPRGIIVGIFQMLAVLAAFPFVLWLISFIESPSVDGALLLVIGLVIVLVGGFACVATGGVDVKKTEHSHS